MKRSPPYPVPMQRRNSSHSLTSYLGRYPGPDLSRDPSSNTLSLDDLLSRRTRRPEPGSCANRSYCFPNGEVFTPRNAPVKRNRPPKIATPKQLAIPRSSSMVLLPSSKASPSSSPFLSASHSFQTLKNKSKQNLAALIRSSKMDTLTNINITSLSHPTTLNATPVPRLYSLTNNRYQENSNNIVRLELVLYNTSFETLNLNQQSSGSNRSSKSNSLSGRSNTNTPQTSLTTSDHGMDAQQLSDDGSSVDENKNKSLESIEEIPPLSVPRKSPPIFVPKDIPFKQPVDPSDIPTPATDTVSPHQPLPEEETTAYDAVDLNNPTPSDNNFSILTIGIEPAQKDPKLTRMESQTNYDAEDASMKHSGDSSFFESASEYLDQSHISEKSAERLVRDTDAKETKVSDESEVPYEAAMEIGKIPILDHVPSHLPSSLSPITEDVATSASIHTGNDLPEPTISLDNYRLPELPRETYHKMQDSATSASMSLASVITLAGSKEISLDNNGVDVEGSALEKKHGTEKKKKIRLKLNKALPPINFEQEGSNTLSADVDIPPRVQSPKLDDPDNSLKKDSSDLEQESKLAIAPHIGNTDLAITNAKNLVPTSKIALLPPPPLDHDTDATLPEIPSPISKDSFRIEKPIKVTSSNNVYEKRCKLPDGVPRKDEDSQAPDLEGRKDIQEFSIEQENNVEPENTNFNSVSSVHLSKYDDNELISAGANRVDLVSGDQSPSTIIINMPPSEKPFANTYLDEKQTTDTAQAIKLDGSQHSPLKTSLISDSSSNASDELSENQINKLLNDDQTEVPPRGDLNIEGKFVKIHKRNASSLSSMGSLGSILNSVQLPPTAEVNEEDEEGPLRKSSPNDDSTALDPDPKKPVVIRRSMYDVVNTDFEKSLPTTPQNVKSMIDDIDLSNVELKLNLNPKLVSSGKAQNSKNSKPSKPSKLKTKSASNLCLKKVLKFFSSEDGQTKNFKKAQKNSIATLTKAKVEVQQSDHEFNGKRNGLSSETSLLKAVETGDVIPSSNKKPKKNKFIKLISPPKPETILLQTNVTNSHSETTMSVPTSQNRLSFNLPAYEVENDTFDDLLLKFDQVEKDAELEIENIMVKPKSLSDLFLKDDELTKDQIADQQRKDNQNSDESLPQRIYENSSSEFTDSTRNFQNFWLLEDEVLNDFQVENLLVRLPKEDGEQRFVLKANQFWKFYDNDRNKFLPAYFKHVKQFQDYDLIEVKVKDFDPEFSDSSSAGSNSDIFTILKSKDEKRRNTRHVKFSNTILITETFAPSMYKRYNKSVTQYYLTESAEINKIKNELNAYKCHEMLVHEKSQMNTHFFY